MTHSNRSLIRLLRRAADIIEAQDAAIDRLRIELENSVPIATSDDVFELYLSKRSSDAVHALGIQTISQLRTVIPETLMSLPNVGRKVINEIAAAIAAFDAEKARGNDSPPSTK